MSYWVGDVLKSDVPVDAQGRRLITMVVLGGSGTFSAPNDAVAWKLAHMTKRAMVAECCDLWPGLLRDGSWSRAYLRSLPSYVLAVILSQI